MVTKKLRPGMLIWYDFQFNHQSVLFFVLVRRLVELEKRHGSSVRECWEYIDPDGVVRYHFFRSDRIHVVETESIEGLDNAKKDEESKTSC